MQLSMQSRWAHIKPPAAKTEFKRIQNFVNVFRGQMVRIADEEMKSLAHEFAETVRQNIYNQTYRLKPLSRAYLRWKRNTGLDERILIATGTYVKSIKAIPRLKTKKTERYVATRPGGPRVLTTIRETRIATWSVGVPDGIHKPSGLPFTTLARIHEFGTRTIPARPHWRPAWSATVRTKGREVIRTVKKRSMRGR
jgi:hypothetical protein